MGKESGVWGRGGGGVADTLDWKKTSREMAMVLVLSPSYGNVSVLV
jgi:hypothetical protein